MIEIISAILVFGFVILTGLFTIPIAVYILRYIYKSI
jgi:hypothetical protein